MDTAPSLYDCRRQQLGADHGVLWRRTPAWLRDRHAALPAAPWALIADAPDALAIADDGRDAACRTMAGARMGAGRIR
jgi:hypothetical protein